MTTEEWRQEYDSLQERFQRLWFENHSIKERYVDLEDKTMDLKKQVKYLSNQLQEYNKAG